ncbi:hypothetical protein SISNIDRAFT_491975 [Sistotremastrum niveocremeum HHB9708]|uniref:Uncharacterized protein n=1 Tax=Sistotremastrum niveocremeum HHB9708 TaxID=1314777 RepID=A0A164M6V1_9AGAM|nr:hypothetical protein SISNIDRAFT_491975 [Sistotremastrum niveocremeum HHB9708]
MSESLDNLPSDVEEPRMSAEEFLKSLETDDHGPWDDYKHVRKIMQVYEDRVAKLLQEHSDFLLTEISSTKEELSLQIQTLETRVKVDLDGLLSDIDHQRTAHMKVHDDLLARLLKLEREFESASSAYAEKAIEFKAALCEIHSLGRELEKLRNQSIGNGSAQHRARRMRQYLWRKLVDIGFCDCVAVTSDPAKDVGGDGADASDRVPLSHRAQQSGRSIISAPLQMVSLQTISLRTHDLSQYLRQSVLAFGCAVIILFLVRLYPSEQRDNPLRSLPPYREGMSRIHLEYIQLMMSTPIPFHKAVPKTKTWNLTVVKTEGAPTVSGIPPPDDVSDLAQALTDGLAISQRPNTPPEPIGTSQALHATPKIDQSPPRPVTLTAPTSASSSDDCNNVLAQPYTKYSHQYRTDKKYKTYSWYESFGSRSLATPPLDPRDPSVNIGDMFFHRYGRDPQVWYCDEAREWTIIRRYEKHQPTGRFLKFNKFGVVSLVIKDELPKSERQALARTQSGSSTLE